VRKTLLCAAGLLFVVLLSRSPFAARTLWAHDSVLYANAMERGFHVDDDLLSQRPHPPGYILYVAAASAARGAGLGSNDALVAVSALASALATVAIFLLARRWTRNAVALVTAAAYAANPLVWQYSEVAYPYTVLALTTVVVAACCLAARGRGVRAAIAASLAFGVAGGFRQDVLVLLFPLWLWTVMPVGRRILMPAASLALGCAVWLVPTVVLSGGVADYFDALQGQATFVSRAYSITAQGFPALLANLGATSWALGWGLLVMAPLALGAGVIVARRTWKTRRADEATFLLLWTLPPLGVYVVLHIGEWGYVLSALPGLYLLGARALEELLVAARSRRRQVIAGAWTALVAVPALLFSVSQIPFSAAAIAEHDLELSTRVSYVRDNYQPKVTLILTREDFLLVRYYLPEYRTRQYDPDPFTRSSRRMRAGRVEKIVVFTEGLVPDRQLDVRRVLCRKGVELVYMDVVPGAVLEFRGERYAVGSPAP
jgi:4-amino-4-deoxy-L-arabinose transferase-like glycosyltransferase